MMRRRSSSFARTALFVIASALVLSACSLPRIIVLHDPLTPEEHDNLGHIYESQGKPDLALEQYREALKLNKKHLPSLLLLGDLSYRQEKYDEAEAAYTKALDLDSKNSDVLNNLAWVYIRTGKKLDTARELITEALEVNPAHRPYYLDTLGVVLLRLGRAGEAVTALEESVATLPQDQQDLLAESRQHLADAYKAVGEGKNQTGQGKENEKQKQ